jgi:hypothetical protein
MPIIFSPEKRCFVLHEPTEEECEALEEIAISYITVTMGKNVAQLAIDKAAEQAVDELELKKPNAIN